MDRLPDGYFDDVYAASADPWRMAERWYEQRKYSITMAMLPDRTLRVLEHFEDSERAKKNLSARAKLAVGEAPGRGVSFADAFKLRSSGTRGSDVVLDLQPRESTGYVLSALYDGPVLFATC